MVKIAGPEDKKPEEYPVLPTEFTNEEIEVMREEIKGKTIDDVLSNPKFKDRDIFVIQGLHYGFHTTYIPGAYFRHGQAEEVEEATKRPAYLFTIWQTPLGMLQQRDFEGANIRFSEEEIKEIYERLKENLQN